MTNTYIYNNICKIVSRNIFLLSKWNQIISNKLAFFSAHILSHINYVWDSCANVHMKRLGSLHKRAVNLMIPNKKCSLQAKVQCSPSTPVRRTRFVQKCVLKQKVVHSKVPQYLRDLILPSGRLNRHRISLKNDTCNLDELHTHTFQRDNLPFPCNVGELHTLTFQRDNLPFPCNVGELHTLTFQIDNLPFPCNVGELHTLTFQWGNMLQNRLRMHSFFYFLLCCPNRNLHKNVGLLFPKESQLRQSRYPTLFHS